MDSANSPYIVKQYHVKGGKYAEESEIEEGEDAESGICRMGKSKAHSADADCCYRMLTASADSCHEVAAENELLAHSLYDVADADTGLWYRS